MAERRGGARAACAERIAAIYTDTGRVEIERGRPAVLHVTAVAREGDAHRTLRIVEAAPTSPTDAFALALARARSDWIVTSGRILREEPALQHGWQGIEGAEALTAWRRERLGRSEPPAVAVLTSGRDLDLDHPAFAERAGRAAIVTGEQAAARMRGPAERRGLEVMARRQPGLRDLVGALREREARAVISVETGPSSSLTLYRAPRLVDELLLSRWQGPLEEAARGGAFLSVDEIEAHFGPAGSWSGLEDDETAGGSWEFARFVAGTRGDRAGRASAPVREGGP